jgi:epoxyqueuosine reductase
MTDVTKALKLHAHSLGADLVGVADLAMLEGIETTPPDLLQPFTRGVSLAVKVPTAVFEQLTDRPTPLYAQAYLNANLLLDQIALRLCGWLEGHGAAALPVPASQVLDMEGLTGHLSAKAVANAAGLGWQGKSLLLVTPQFGPRVRLVTVLTDLPLVAGEPMKNRCGSCTNCSDACVAQAIRNASTAFHFESRDEALDLRKCADKLVDDFKTLPLVDKPICGICIKVCPWGRNGSGKGA